jgi:biopolymer transport protein ExbD
MHGGGGTDSGGKKKARIEIIPLIDVIFFLLATFVLFTLSLNKTGGLSVLLPAAETSIPRDTAGTVTLSVTAEGTLAWNKDVITLDEFLDRIQRYKIEEAEPRVLINADERALYAQVVYVVDQVRLAQIPKIYIETRIFQSK